MQAWSTCRGHLEETKLHWFHASGPPREALFPPLGAKPKPPLPLPSGPLGDLIGSTTISRDSELLELISGFGAYFGSYNSLFPGDGAGAILLGFSDREEVDDNGRDESPFLPPAPAPPPLPRDRFGVADREPGGVSAGEEAPDPALVVDADPNNSNRLSSYLRCFSSLSLTASARCSSTVGFFSSASSEDASPFTSSGATGGAFLDSNRGGGLKSAFGTTPRVSRK
jgi:hypothetical protein